MMKNVKKNCLILLIAGIMLATTACHRRSEIPCSHRCVSGIYPHLAMYNNEGECGTGAVVVWAGRLWAITYGPHLPYGSSDKLYEITGNLEQRIRPESTGGTPANRMIHKESGQLFIGPYAIDSTGKVRVIPYALMPGRPTGNARHLTEPDKKIYYATMEAGFYEVDVRSLAVKMLYPDANTLQEKGKDLSTERTYRLLPGAHGKGLYSGQGVLIFSNNGEPSREALSNPCIEAGVLAEWNGKTWKVIRRNQFTEITGPGGIYGNSDPATDPIWATGWDSKSILLGLRDKGTWTFFRLPKASHTYDGAHGWNTEWPRIRNIGSESEPDFLMTMHGMFWHFPHTFCTGSTKGIRPRSAYLKVIGDFTRWGDKIVFGCDDAAKNEFLNKRQIKGGMAGPGQSQSNLWFVAPSRLDSLGPTDAEGALWISETIHGMIPSDPFLFAGWTTRMAAISNEGHDPVLFVFETDKEGNGRWEKIKSLTVNAGEAVFTEFPSSVAGEWIRVYTDKKTRATVHFTYSNEEKRTTTASAIFKGLSSVDDEQSLGGLLYAPGNNRRTLGMVAYTFHPQERQEQGYYELDSCLQLVKKEDTAMASFIRTSVAIPAMPVQVDKASVLIIDERQRRWRLPLGDEKYTSLMQQSATRICREVVTERDLMNCHGTFYELPAENAGGFAWIRPIASHHFRIHDYASYRGMLVLTGINPSLSIQNPHLVRSKDNKACVWVGTIDDLWQLGKPAGKGGPWKDDSVKAGIPSDPYLMAFYDRKELELSHDNATPVTFAIEIDPTGYGTWMVYKKITVRPHEKFHYVFPSWLRGRWIRFRTDKDCQATAWLEYK